MKFKFKPLLISFLLLIIITLLVLFSKSTLNNALKTNEPQKPIIIGFAQLGSESAWRNANTESIISAAKEANVNLIFKNAEGSQKLQKNIIRDFIIQQVDIIILSPLIETGWDDILQEAKKANIPVIIADREIKTQKSNLYSVFVGSDFASEGVKAGKWLIENVNPNKKINIVELEGLAGSTPTVNRAKGFRAAINKHPNITFLESVPGDFIKAKGKLEMTKLLNKYGKKINLVFAHNDDMAIGAIEAIEEFNLKPGKDIIIISVDGQKSALEAIKAGKSNVSVECTPLQGPVLMKTAKKILAGEELPNKIIMEEKIFTKENVDAELPLRSY